MCSLRTRIILVGRVFIYKGIYKGMMLGLENERKS